MEWSHLPTAAGWYFFARNRSCPPLPVLVERREHVDGTEFLVAGWARNPVSETSGFWFGPIPLPEPPT